MFFAFFLSTVNHFPPPPVLLHMIDQRGVIDFRKKVRIRKETDTSTTAGGKKRVVRPRKLDQPACRWEASDTQDLGVTSLHPVGRHHLDRKVAGDYQ